jgi:quercetin 2,3-dioxygenase
MMSETPKSFKKLAFLRSNIDGHWVGDGFPVRSIFSYHELGEELSPFLLFDYAGPTTFSPTTQRRGVGAHPHRGFETVSIVYHGEVEHRDSAGAGGTIGPGDVQWMTAASGIVHEEFHGKTYASTGGPFEMIQIWVNLPRNAKMGPPNYQGITDGNIPRVSLPNQAGVLRLIAGDYSAEDGTIHKGAASTFSPIQLWDVHLEKGAIFEWSPPLGHTSALFVLKGEIQLISGESIGSAELGVFDRENSTLHLTATEETQFLYLGGEPMREPIVGHGPFVMNTEEEIRQAFLDYRAGRMGALI